MSVVRSGVITVLGTSTRDLELLVNFAALCGSAVVARGVAQPSAANAITCHEKRWECLRLLARLPLEPTRERWCKAVCFSIISCGENSDDANWWNFATHAFLVSAEYLPSLPE